MHPLDVTKRKGSNKSSRTPCKSQKAESPASAVAMPPVCQTPLDVSKMPIGGSASGADGPSVFSRTAARWCRPLDALPQTGLFVEAIEFDAAEIETRDDSHHFAVVDDRHMAIASILHQP